MSGKRKSFKRNINLNIYNNARSNEQLKAYVLLTRTSSALQGNAQKEELAFNHSFRKNRLRSGIHHERTLLALLFDSSSLFYLSLTREEKADIYNRGEKNAVALHRLLDSRAPLETFFPLISRKLRGALSRM